MYIVHKCHIFYSYIELKTRDTIDLLEKITFDKKNYINCLASLVTFKIQKQNFNAFISRDNYCVLILIHMFFYSHVRVTYS